MTGMFKGGGGAGPIETVATEVKKQEAASQSAGVLADTQAKAAAAASPAGQEQIDLLSASVRRKRKGMASTITGASEGSSTAGSVASKTLLGM